MGSLRTFHLNFNRPRIISKRALSPHLFPCPGHYDGDLTWYVGLTVLLNPIMFVFLPDIQSNTHHVYTLNCHSGHRKKKKNINFSPPSLSHATDSLSETAPPVHKWKKKKRKSQPRSQLNSRLSSQLSYFPVKLTTDSTLVPPGCGDHNQYPFPMNGN